MAVFSQYMQLVYSLTVRNCGGAGKENQEINGETVDSSSHNRQLSPGRREIQGGKKPKEHFNTFKEIRSQLTQYKRHRKDWGIPSRDFQDSTFSPPTSINDPLLQFAYFWLSSSFPTAWNLTS